MFTVKSEPDPAAALPFFALLVAQATLLGILAVVAFRDGKHFVLCGGVGFLWTVFTIEDWGDLPAKIIFYSATMIVFPVWAVVFSTLYVTKGARLVQSPNQRHRATTDDLRYSIRHVMILTAVVAA
ncbi:MAG: hypothetical protein WBF93_17090 [Pirellulales bacterium]